MMSTILLSTAGIVFFVLLVDSVMQESQPQRITRTPNPHWDAAVKQPAIAVAEHPPRLVAATTGLYQIRNVTKRYGKGVDAVDALRGVNLDIGDGVTAITGANGSGKSTLMGLAGALDSPTSGEIWYRGQRMSFENASAMNRFRAHIPAWIMQNLNLFDDQSAVENVAFSLTRYGSPYRPALDAAFQQLAAVGVDTKTAKRLPRCLSGGQRQRVAIARALLAHKLGGAEVILADEPTASVDSTDAINVFRMLVDLSHKHGVPTIVVTHEPRLAEMADRIVICENGTIRDA